MKVSMKQRVLRGWNVQRIMFLVMGTMVMVQSSITADWLGVLIGLYFMSMGIFALGCASGNCFSGQCKTTIADSEAPNSSQQNS
jgi:hypothetical protein